MTGRNSGSFRCLPGDGRPVLMRQAGKKKRERGHQNAAEKTTDRIRDTDKGRS